VRTFIASILSAAALCVLAPHAQAQRRLCTEGQTDCGLADQNCVYSRCYTVGTIHSRNVLSGRECSYKHGYCPSGKLPESDGEAPKGPEDENSPTAPTE
jgi:hypothetical protein